MQHAADVHEPDGRASGPALGESERARSLRLVWGYYPDTTLAFACRATAKVLGRARDEMLGARWVDWLAEERRAGVLSALERLSPGESFTHEDLLASPDGAVVRLSWTHRATFDEQGQQRRFQCVLCELPAPHVDSAPTTLQSSPDQPAQAAPETAAVIGSDTTAEGLSMDRKSEDLQQPAEGGLGGVGTPKNDAFSGRGGGCLPGMTSERAGDLSTALDELAGAATEAVPAPAPATPPKASSKAVATKPGRRKETRAKGPKAKPAAKAPAAPELPDDDLTVLRVALGACASTGELEQRLPQWFAEQLGFPAVFLRRVERFTLHAVTVSGYGIPPFTEFPPRTVGDVCPGDEKELADVIVVTAFQDDEANKRYFEWTLGTRTLICTPLRAGGLIYGTLHLTDPIERAVSEATRDLVRRASTVVAEAFARLDAPTSGR